MRVRIKSMAVFHKVPLSMEMSVPAGSDIAGLIKQVSVSYPEFGETLIEEGDIHSQIVVLHNGVSILQRQGLKSILEDKDELYIVPMIDGG